jgi:hypothetical protein
MGSLGLPLLGAALAFRMHPSARSTPKTGLTPPADQKSN